METGIYEIRVDQIEAAADVIRRSFATVAQEFGITRENCPGHVGFMTADRLQSEIAAGYRSFGYFSDGEMAGHVSLTDKGDGTYELKRLAVLPEFRHKGIGGILLDFCKRRTVELGGRKIILDVIEENERLKAWYIVNGFVHTGTRSYAHLPFTVGDLQWEDTPC